MDLKSILNPQGEHRDSSEEPSTTPSQPQADEATKNVVSNKCQFCESGLKPRADFWICSLCVAEWESKWPSNVPKLPPISQLASEIPDITPDWIPIDGITSPPPGGKRKNPFESGPFEPRQRNETPDNYFIEEFPITTPPTPRSPSNASSFGSANSGISHPPRTEHTKRKNSFSMSFADFASQCEDASSSSRVRSWVDDEDRLIRHQARRLTAALRRSYHYGTTHSQRRSPGVE